MRNMNSQYSRTQGIDVLLFSAPVGF